MKKHSFLSFLLTTFFFGSIFAFSSEVQGPEVDQEDDRNAINNDEYYIFIGNPGVGKSTLINSLVGRTVTASGVNAGIGLTQFFQRYKHQGKYYLDTPGLSDLQLRKRAAEEIEKALKEDGKYRIFFVMTLQAGRVRPEDIATINTVMDAIQDGNGTFNILINKVNLREKKSIMGNPVFLAQLYSQINSGKHKTDSIYYIEDDYRIHNEDSEYIIINEELKSFIYRDSKSIVIAPQKVKALQIDEFEQITIKYTKQMKCLQEKIERGDAAMKKLVNKLSELQKEHAKHQEEAKDNQRKDKEELEKIKNTRSSSTIVVLPCSVM